MAFATLTIPLVHGLAKYLSNTYSSLVLSWTRYAAASLIVLPFAARVHGSQIFPRERRIPHLLRTLFLIAAMTLYFLSIAPIHFSTAASIYFIGPIIAVVPSVILLKDRMTSRKVLSLTSGFIGSTVILRPSSSTEVGVLLALGAGIFFAFYLIATPQAVQVGEVTRCARVLSRPQKTGDFA